MNPNIGYYKYETSNGKNYEFINYYPITDEIKEYLIKVGNFKYEFDGDNLKKINGKLVVLI